MLSPRKKITRKEIKEDLLVTKYFQVQKYYQKYSKPIHSVVGALFLIIVVMLLVTLSKRKAEVKASEQMGLSEQYYFMSDHQKSITELSNVVNTYSGTQTAGQAAFFLANSYYAQNDYLNAQKYYKIYLDDYSNDDLLSASSLVGMAACFENQNQFDKAAQLYEKAGKKVSRSYAAPFYFKDAGRCYVLAKNIQKGKAMYEIVLKQYSKSNIVKEVEYLLESL